MQCAIQTIYDDVLVVDPFLLQGALNLQDEFLEGDKKLHAHFGQAIAAVGDLNKDGFEGIIILDCHIICLFCLSKLVPSAAKAISISILGLQCMQRATVT